jgi:hypothetical protein
MVKHLPANQNFGTIDVVSAGRNRFVPAYGSRISFQRRRGLIDVEKKSRSFLLKMLEAFPEEQESPNQDSDQNRR